MNIENEINKHDPISIDDVSSVHFDLDFEEAISELPECIICRLTDLEDYYEDLSKNTFCKCNFYFHPSCYEEWAQYKKSNTCLICNKDISSNYYIPSPEISPRSRLEIITMRRRELIRMRNERIRERNPNCSDKCCNIICCKIPCNSRNSLITYIHINDNRIGSFFCITGIILIFLAAFIIIYLAATNPTIFSFPSP